MVAVVTGASGFVGSAVVRKLVGRGEHVRAIVRKDSDTSNLSGLKIERVVGDLRDAQSLSTAMRGADALYHVAADYRLWAPHDEDIFATNVIGTENVIRAAVDAGVRRIVHTSSVCTLGTNKEGTPADENSTTSDRDMIGAYKKSKYLAEKCAYQWTARGAPIVIVNPSTPIGPRDIKPTPTGRMIREAAFGKMPAFVSTGLNFVHVDDVAAGHLLAHDKGQIGERYILGGYNLSLKSLLLLIADMVGRRPPQVEVSRRAIYPIAFVAEAIAKFTECEPFVTVNGLRLAKKKMYFSSARAQRELGYSFGPMKKALADALVWFGASLVRRPLSGEALESAMVRGVQ